MCVDGHVTFGQILSRHASGLAAVSQPERGLSDDCLIH
jgi:hypothetical protein